MPARICTLVVVVLAFWTAVTLADAESKTRPRVCQDSKEVSFARDVLPPLQESCAGCHHSEEAVPSLNLTGPASYSNTVGRKSTFVDELLVSPGDPDHSFLVEKIGGKPRFGQQMPSYGRPLTRRELRLLIDWIKQGAKNN
jgi:hypothetical protein